MLSAARLSWGLYLKRAPRCEVVRARTTFALAREPRARLNLASGVRPSSSSQAAGGGDSADAVLRDRLPPLPPDRAPPDATRIAFPKGACVIAIGDVHGDLTAFRAQLYAALLVDPKTGAWAGGRDVLVQAIRATSRGLSRWRSSV